VAVGSTGVISVSFRRFVFEVIQCVPFATEPGISLIILTPMKIFATKFEQEYVRCVRNEKECVCIAPNCCDTEQRSASQPAGFLPDALGLVASGTQGI